MAAGIRQVQAAIQEALHHIAKLEDTKDEVSNNIQRYSQALAELDRKAPALGQLTVPGTLVAHVDEAGDPQKWCHSVAKRYAATMKEAQGRRDPLRSLSRSLRSKGWALSSLARLATVQKTRGWWDGPVDSSTSCSRPSGKLQLWQWNGTTQARGSGSWRKGGEAEARGSCATRAGKE
ncbi:unnamed protein product [Effrenium voratum]|uniref:Mediator of RNA polymerase II transcription subunit 10 n=1 Tax=Effrenium voratum TaxID=2562239 RepID=A0AA36MRD6_9DINO|nr:unnamed protein product [Effrenium voratum]